MAKKEAIAFLLGEETMPEIVTRTGIEEQVLKDWLAHDVSFGLQTKVIVVTITEEEKNDGRGKED